MTSRDRLLAPRRARRRSVWVSRNVNNEALAPLGKSLIQIDNNRQVANAEGLTLVRTLLDVSFASETAGGQAELGMGVVLVNEDVTSATAPDPNEGAEDADWIYMVKLLFHEWNTGTGKFFRHIHADIRSSRKYGQGDELAFITYNDDATDDIIVKGSIRALLLLP